MMIYGGSTKNGGLAEDEIWLLYLNEGAEGEGEWKRYQVTNGQSPGPRYGHSLNFIKPFFVLFGGNFNPSLSNDVWIVNINETIGEWKKIIFQNDVGPCPRLYHTSQICNHGKYLGKLIIFGGRDSNENPLNDIWILELNKEGSWNWTRAFVKNSDELFPRYNHSMIFYNDLMIIGFNSKTPTQSVGNLSRISLEKIFHKSSLLNKLDINKDSADKNKINKINKKNNLANNKSQFKLSPDVIIGSGGVAIEGEEDQIQDDQSMFHVVHIDKLTEENKRIGQVPKKNSYRLCFVLLIGLIIKKSILYMNHCLLLIKKYSI